jgi:hypothetical protein
MSYRSCSLLYPLPPTPRRTVAHGRPIGYMNRNAPVAQLDRALPSEGKGHTFESCRVRQLFYVLQRDMHA